MTLEIRPMTREEQKYSYTQSHQIAGQTGCIGHLRADMDTDGKDEARSLVDEYNTKAGVTKAQEAAMAAGSRFGFDVPAADPANYDENGQPIKPKNRNRDYER